MRIQKRWIIAGLILCLQLSWLQAQNALLAAEDARFAAQVARDVQRLDKMLDESLVYIHSNALVESRADFLESVGSGRIVYQLMQAEPDRQLRKIGRRQTVVNGIAKVEGIYSQRPFSMRLRYTAVYIRKQGRWLLNSWQSTRIPD